MSFVVIDPGFYPGPAPGQGNRAVLSKDNGIFDARVKKEGRPKTGDRRPETEDLCVFAALREIFGFIQSRKEDRKTGFSQSRKAAKKTEDRRPKTEDQRQKPDAGSRKPEAGSKRLYKVYVRDQQVASSPPAIQARRRILAMTEDPFDVLHGSLPPAPCLLFLPHAASRMPQAATNNHYLCNLNTAIMQPAIVQVSEKKLVGLRSLMSLADNRTFMLWKSFMPRRKEILNNLNSDLISMQIYPAGYFDAYSPGTLFEKWAAAEVADFENVPHEMETFILPAGLYAIFDYTGLNSDDTIFRYIFETWLPGSGYLPDDRPHFEILGSRYKNNDPSSEEKICIPLKPRNAFGY